MRIGFIFHTFSFGGHEREVINFIQHGGHEWLGIAVEHPQPLPSLPLNFPPIRYDFAAAVKDFAEQADVLIVWGVANLPEHLPKGKLPPIVAMSKADGPWSEKFCHPNALLTPWLMSNSSKASEAYPELVRSKVTIIHDGIDPARVRPHVTRAVQRRAWAIPEDAKVVGYIGRICKDKGTDHTVKAVALLHDWYAVFVGVAPTSDYAGQLRQLCEAYIPGRWRVLPWVDEPGNALNAIDVFCHPSEREGFSNSIAEAWLAGVPTIYTRGSGAATDLPGMGIEVSPHPSSHELALAILQAPALNTAFAREVMYDGYLIKDNVKRWNDYLAEVTTVTPKPRVLCLLNNVLVGGVSTWFLSLQRHCKAVEFVSLVTCARTEKASDLITNRLQCPHAHIDNGPDARAELAETLNYTRPDLILAWGVANLGELLPDDCPPVVLVSHNHGKSKEAAWAQRVLNNSCKAAAYHVAVSYEAATAFPSVVKVEVIPNGVELPSNPNRNEARSVLQLEETQIAVAYVGRLSADKNYLDAAKAVSVLGPNYRAIYIGPREDEEAEAKIRAITDRVLILPKLAPEQAAALYPAFDCCFCTSENEGFGLSIVEAWAHGVPVVATRVGVLLQSPLAVIVPKHASPARLAVAVERALSKGFKPTIERARHQAYESYSAVRMAADWDEYLTGIAQRRH